MNSKPLKINIVNSNTLKIVAAVCMLIDHIGYILLPNIVFLRIIGRLAFPIFAFFIAEGCKYTKNKLKYFLIIFVLGVIFQVAYYIAEESLFMNIFIVFSLSILIIYTLQNFKYNLINKQSGILNKVLSGIVFVVTIFLVFFFCSIISVDYGFWGVMLPVFASLFHNNGEGNVQKKLNSVTVSLISFAVGLILLCVFAEWSIQYYSLISLLLLVLYSGERGRANLKYFFYIFYPAHLVVLYAIDLLIYYL